MENTSAIQLFEDQPIRAAWDEEKEEWYFSIVDVVRVLTEQPDTRHAAKYWSVLKTRIKAESGQLTTICSQLKLKSADGKRYLTDVADTEQLLRIIQSIPSPKAEPILWSSLIRPLYVRIAQKQPETACFLGFFVFTAVCIMLLPPAKSVGWLSTSVPQPHRRQREPRKN